jgi:hypothetical protein
MKVAQKYDRSEHDEQVTIFRWASIAQHQYPGLELLFAIPNGGHRYKAVAGKLKAEGVKSGVPDMCLPIAKKGYNALYIELKKKTGGRVTGHQRWWLSALERAGSKAVVCRGADEAIELISWYLGG